MALRPIPVYRSVPWLGPLRTMAADPLNFLLQLAETYGPIVHFRLAGMPFYLISAPDLIRDVLVTHADTFRKADRDALILGRFLGRGLVPNNDIPFHRRQRKLIQPVFHARTIHGYADLMVDYTRRMLDEWRDGDERNLSHELAQLTLFIVSRALYSADRDAMAGRAQRISSAVGVLQATSLAEFQAPVIWPEWWPNRLNRGRRAARHVLYAEIERLIAERRAAGLPDTGDLLSLLLRAEYDDGTRMADQQVRDELVTLFVAGHETTANALTWAWYLLAHHPAVAARLHAELHATLGERPPTLADLPRLPYTLQIIKETLRLYPPAWLLNTRQPATAVTIGDYALPAGSQVFVAPYVMHRLARYWDAPDRFDPDRFTPEREKALDRLVYLPFGAGPRICIGNSFALLEAHLILATMAQRFDMTLLDPPPAPLNPQITLSPRGGLRVRVRARPAVVGR